MDKQLSTYERLMQDPEFKDMFEKEYKEFLISEFLIDIMDDKNISVRKLSKETGISTSIIQNLRSGKSKNLTIKTFLNLVNTLGYNVIIEGKGKRMVVENNKQL